MTSLHRLGEGTCFQGCRQLCDWRCLRQLHDAGRGGTRDSRFGTNLQRLAQVKKKFDPDNIFRANQNIAPAVS